MMRVYRNSYANVHRGAYTLSQEATEAYEEARRKVARFLNAAADEEVIFTRSATAAMNQFAYGWGLNTLKPGDRVLTSVMEHHANIVPWHIIARHTGAELAYLDLTDDFRIDPAGAQDSFDERVKIVALSGMSNVLGTMPPIAEIARMAHEVGAVMLVRRGTTGPALAGGRPNAGRRLSGLLRSQDARSHRGRSAVGTAGAAGGDGAGGGGRRDDPRCPTVRVHLGPGATQIRGWYPTVRWRPSRWEQPSTTYPISEWTTYWNTTAG